MIGATDNTMITMLRYEMLDQHLLLDPQCLRLFTNLKNFHARFDTSSASNSNSNDEKRFEKLNMCIGVEQISVF